MIEFNESLVGKHVLHHPTGVVGRVTAVRSDGDEHSWGTVEVDPGHTLWADPSAFRALTEGEVAWINALAGNLRALLVESVPIAAGLGVEANAALELTVALLTSQARALVASEG